MENKLQQESKVQNQAQEVLDDQPPAAGPGPFPDDDAGRRAMADARESKKSLTGGLNLSHTAIRHVCMMIKQYVN